ncbi:MAG TPA: heme lyase CcmF/NrfE family subunit [Acidimicrobiales bacterium]|nr:heme lyase CcmF/NrfE family subunit [Acidimicrobiales bacterium]
MNSWIGHLGIWIGLSGSVATIAMCLLTLWPGSVNLVSRLWVAAFVPLLGALVATFAMEHALVTHDFSLAYVASNNSRETPLLYSITGMWSALQGSILLWVLVLTGYLCAMAIRFRARCEDRLFVIALGIVGLVALFFFYLISGPADPFAEVSRAVADGTGPNPLLQDNLLIAFHPVFLYLGYVGFTVPFAFALASLITGRIGEGWLIATRRAAVFAWACLTVGIVLGAWWSYQSLGWGGAWGWDPVENVALLPWLTATAYLHSVMVQERRGLLRIWNLSLLVATFSLTILGTFLTRSGVVVSVHAFSNSDIGPTLLSFFAVIVLASVGLIGWRGDRLVSSGSIDAPISREGAFLANNLIFACFAFVVLLGTVAPVIVEAVSGGAISIGRPYFDTFTVPLGIALLFIMAIAPALPWRKAGAGVMRARILIPAWSAVGLLAILVLVGVRGFVPLLTFSLGGFAATSALRQLALATLGAHRHGLPPWRGLVGRANGGMVTHLGVICVAVALCASTSYATRTLITLKPGASTVVAGRELTFVGWQTVNAPAAKGYLAKVRIGGDGIFRPGIVNYDNSPSSTALPSIDSTATQDLYLELASGAGLGLPVSIEVISEPLVMWLWIGGAICALGALLALVPGSRRRPTDPSTVTLPEFLGASPVGGR